MVELLSRCCLLPSDHHCTPNQFGNGDLVSTRSKIFTGHSSESETSKVQRRFDGERGREEHPQISGYKMEGRTNHGCSAFQHHRRISPSSLLE